MIRKNLKKERGISLVALTITVIVMIILANVIIYNLKDNLKLNNLEKMYNDIDNLKDKVSAYYAQYGAIPYLSDIGEYTNTGHMASDISVADGNGDFYVIDLSVFENLTLNYGKDLKKIKEKIVAGDSVTVNNYKDLYIINDVTHNIFYVEGIKIDNKTYYTDEEPDEVGVDLFSFSLKEVKEKGSTFYSNVTLGDDYGNKMVLPEGFGIAGDSATKITEGVVIEDKDGNQFVWIPVGTVYKNEAKTESETINLGRYDFGENGEVSDYSGSCVEEYSTEEETLKNYGNTIAKDLKEFEESVSISNGYYIGRYEARTVEASARTAVTANDNDLAKMTEKSDGYIYNYVKQTQAAELSSKMYESDSFETDLMNSYAWDTATLFLQKFDNRTYTVEDNPNKVNYYSRQMRLSTGLKNTGTNNLTNTSNIDKICNVYDMADNCYEWSTETSEDSNYPCVLRGGTYFDSGSYTSSSTHNDIDYADDWYAFRPILYIKNRQMQKESTNKIETRIKVGNKAEVNGTVDGNEASYSNPIIPKGFKAIDVGDAKWGTATGYQYGLIIEDAESTSETVGSQFVWVPVEDYENKFHLIEGYCEGELDSILIYSKEAGSTSTEGSPINNNVAGTTESIKMYKSVKDNGGFYIARYEAGISGTT